MQARLRRIVLERDALPRGSHVIGAVRVAAFCDDLTLAASALRRLERNRRRSGGPAAYEIVGWRSDQGPQTQAEHEAEARRTALAVAAEILEADEQNGAGALLASAAAASANGRIWREVGAHGKRRTATSERLAGMLALAMPRTVGRALGRRRWPMRWVPEGRRAYGRPQNLRAANRAAAVAVLAWRISRGQWPQPEDPVATAWRSGRTTTADETGPRRNMTGEPTFRWHTPEEADMRLGELMLAIAHRAGAMRSAEIDMTAWRADMAAYTALAAPLSGAAYRRAAAGVTPENAISIRAVLAQRGDAAWTRGDRWKARRDGRLDTLGNTDTAAADIERMVGVALKRPARWPVPRKLIQSLPTGMAIPYEAALLSDSGADASERAATRRWAERKGIDLDGNG